MFPIEFREKILILFSYFLRAIANKALSYKYVSLLSEYRSGRSQVRVETMLIQYRMKYRLQRIHIEYLFPVASELERPLLQAAV